MCGDRVPPRQRSSVRILLDAEPIFRRNIVSYGTALVGLTHGCDVDPVENRQLKLVTKRRGALMPRRTRSTADTAIWCWSQHVAITIKSLHFTGRNRNQRTKLTTMVAMQTGFLPNHCHRTYLAFRLPTHPDNHAKMRPTVKPSFPTPLSK